MTKKSNLTPTSASAPQSQPKTGSESRERILEEAKKLFRQKGFEGVSLNDIVDAVGVKKPTIYYYFGDKQGLFTEVMVAMLRRGHDFVTANLRTGMSLTEKLEKLSEGYLRCSPTSMMAMMRDTQNYLDPSAQQAVTEAYRFYVLKPFKRLFQEAIQAREIKPLDPLDLAILYIGLIDTMTTQKTILQSRDFDHQASANTLVSMMLHGILIRP